MFKSNPYKKIWGRRNLSKIFFSLLVLIVFAGCTANQALNPTETASLPEVTLVNTPVNTEPVSATEESPSQTDAAVTAESPVGVTPVAKGSALDLQKAWEVYAKENGLDKQLQIKTGFWKQIELSQTMLDIAQKSALDPQNNPNGLTFLGDCQNVPTAFLGPLGTPEEFNLGLYANYFAETLSRYGPAFTAERIAVRGGQNVAAVHNPTLLKAEAPQDCKDKMLSPAACALEDKALIALISFEENWAQDTEKHERYLRKLIDLVIAEGHIPVLINSASGGDPAKPDTYNAMISKIALSYKTPLVDVWSVLQPLDKHGLSPDGFHLTTLGFEADFMKLGISKELTGVQTRNLTVLLALDGISKQLKE